MATPPHVRSLFDELSGDIYDFYVASAVVDGDTRSDEELAAAARQLSACLIKWGWRKAVPPPYSNAGLIA